MKIDSSNIQLDVDYYNMDSTFIRSNGVELAKWNAHYKENIPEAYEFELGMGLQLQNPDDTSVLRNIALFAKDPFMVKYEEEIAKKFPSPIQFHQEIVLGLRNVKFHLVESKIPTAIVFANTCFQSSAFSTQNEIVIGLERYLGPTNPLIQQLPAEVFFQWIKEGMDEKYLSRDAVCSWIMSNVVELKEGTLAENMINWGKVIYFTQAAFPEKPEEIIIRYSAEDLKWAKENEFSLWDYLVKEKMLFRVNETESINMLAPGPFTVGLPEKGPDRLGQFLGWQMVRKYMEKNEVTLQQLQKTPYNKILQAYEID
ncbi:MAG: hypothetical protein WC044_05490 [Crocinitomicaceae bacterium]